MSCEDNFVKISRTVSPIPTGLRFSRDKTESERLHQDCENT